MAVAAVGLVFLIGSAMASTGSARKLQQNCNSGCLSWASGGRVWGGTRTCAVCCTGYYLQAGGCVAQSTTAVVAPVAVPYRPVYGPYRGGGAVGSTTTTAVRVNPPGPRPPTTVARTTTTRGAVHRGMKLLQLALGSGVAAPVDARRHLLASCSGGCASWRNGSGGRRTCATCCSGYYMQNGACKAQSTAVKKKPSGGATATRTTAAGWRHGH